MNSIVMKEEANKRDLILIRSEKNQLNLVLDSQGMSGGWKFFCVTIPLSRVQQLSDVRY